MPTASRKPTPGAADQRPLEARWPATLAIVAAMGLDIAPLAGRAVDVLT